MGSDGKIPDALIPDGYATLGSDGKLAEAQRWEIDAYTKEETDQKIAAAAGQSGAGVPAGSVIWFAGETPPEGYLICNGAVVERSTYAALFGAIGTTFGKGDGETTFALPDLHAKIIEGNRLTIGKADTFVAGQGSRITRTLTLLPCIKY